MSDKVRFGIIACSSVARRRFLPALQTAANARLERIGSREPAKAKEFAPAFGCAKTGSYEDVLADPAVDAVYISTPAGLHEEWIRKAAQAHKHILCEKPALLSYRAATELVQRCAENGVRLMEGYMFKYHPQHALVRSLIQEDHIGLPQIFNGEFTLPRPPENDVRLNPQLGGGVFRDAAGYPVAATLHLLPSVPTSVYNQIIIDPESGVDKTVSMMIRFSGGETAQVVAAYGVHYRSKYVLLGRLGSLAVERAFAVPPDMTTTIRLETKEGVKEFSVESADQFRLMIEDFAAQVAGRAPKKDFEGDLLRQHRLMDAAWRSHEEQRPVSLAEYS